MNSRTCLFISAKKGSCNCDRDGPESTDHSSAAFGVITTLRNHHLHCSQTLSPPREETPHPRSSRSCALPRPLATPTCLPSLACSGPFVEMDRALCVLSCLASFTQRHVPGVRLRCTGPRFLLTAELHSSAMSAVFTWKSHASSTQFTPLTLCSL